ncbi:chloramphenicol acetyltransferase [Marinigracilibium pacificum]|uniref:Chloramphenicol acetyltransferase n=1 Tax=Marinigracilibium pacificum TaxID=2729599 RepID=A0A848J148_9BACT|nr:chloramphenicol acetyltransferase [Marinigracilibium pacificum]NMM48270.1 chloramphenicol acetyltransferase [Marinigracilibium pacificum]
MAKFKILDIDNWNRREHYHFFKSFDEPFYGLTADVKCTGGYKWCKANEESFSLFYMHSILKAVNSVKAFRLRITDEDKVVEFESIGISSTVLRDDKTFGFSNIAYNDDFKVFNKMVNKEFERVKNSSGLDVSKNTIDVIHFSSIPWVKFTSISHARTFGTKDSCPKISVGKLTDISGEKVIPVSVHVHHALVDGYDVGLFFQALENNLNQY